MDLAAELERMIPTLMAEHDIPGVSVALIEGASVAWAKGFGVLTKPAFAHGLLQLVDAGRITLDTRLSDLIDEAFVPDDPRAEEITVRHALSHSTGLPNWRGDDPFVTAHEPGSAFRYSGEGYVYLSKVAEALTGRPVHEWLRDTVLDPLGMQVSSLVWEDRFEDLAADGQGWKREVVETWKGDTANVAWSMHTTPTEFAKLTIAMMDSPPSSACLLSDSLRRESLRAQVSVEDDIAWGLGWGLVTEPDDGTFWHWGENPSFTCFVVGSAPQRRGLVVMTNSSFGPRVSREVVKAGVGYEYPPFSPSLITVF